MPVPRRKLSTPLKQPSEVAHEVEESHPHVADVDPEPAAEPEPQRPAAARTEEPTFFEDLDDQHAAADGAADDLFAEPAAEGDLPPPAYQPRPAAEAQPEHTAEQTPEEFVAPQAPKPGTPSPEALARLQQAVNRGPRPAAEKPAQEAPQGERSRFGINSFINRMTGHGEERAAPQQAARQTRQQPPVQAPAPAPEPRQQPAAREADPDEERIEIPAFLRRQAN